MSARPSLIRSTLQASTWTRQRTPKYICIQCRPIQISAAPSSGPGASGDAFGSHGGLRDNADARFEVIGSPHSMLSVSLSPSQKLFTRRGTLVAVAGNPDSAQSTLSVLSPLSRIFFGVPFLYQRITSTAPITALISTKSVATTFSVLHLDGTTDWMVSQRNALLAWTGHTLTPRQRLQTGLTVAHWGSTLLTGRGLAALSSPGQIYKLTLAAGEEFVAHPSHVVAYSVSPTPPLPFRFKGSNIKLQVPSVVSGWFSSLKFVQDVKNTEVYRIATRAAHSIRTSLRRTIWGDRLFLQFQGPSTLFLSSRGVHVADSLTREDVNEIADAPEGKLNGPVGLAQPKQIQGVKTPESAIKVEKSTEGTTVVLEEKKELRESLA
ncbi:altered inheritance-mitochondria protein 24, mitochondrial [Ceratocystis lukuohia]|uniref:Altered inheritance of mitochondria protein 24, mitochondrial n=1 Tax=Ceratocystis lukuohia TaxID=2019550 RepID=A0ABR4MRG4_9PEZI